MTVQFAKWGNSVALRIPAHLLKEMGVNEGSLADAVLENGKLVLSPISTHRRYSLGELLIGLTKDNVYDDIDNGPPVGREVW